VPSSSLPVISDILKEFSQSRAAENVAKVAATARKRKGSSAASRGAAKRRARSRQRPEAPGPGQQTANPQASKPITELQVCHSFFSRLKKLTGDVDNSAVGAMQLARFAKSHRTAPANSASRGSRGVA
jgi:hypothetical protein